MIFIFIPGQHYFACRNAQGDNKHLIYALNLYF